MTANPNGIRDGQIVSAYHNNVPGFRRSAYRTRKEMILKGVRHEYPSWN
jgi:hypothetical protein